MMDPLRDNVVDAVRRIIDSGAKVIMITGKSSPHTYIHTYIHTCTYSYTHTYIGDAEATALSVAKLAGIYSGPIGE